MLSPREAEAAPNQQSEKCKSRLLPQGRGWGGIICISNELLGPRCLVWTRTHAC